MSDPAEAADVDTSRAHKRWCSALITGCDCGLEAVIRSESAGTLEALTRCAEELTVLRAESAGTPHRHRFEYVGSLLGKTCIDCGVAESAGTPLTDDERAELELLARIEEWTKAEPKMNGPYYPNMLNRERINKLARETIDAILDSDTPETP